MVTSIGRPGFRRGLAVLAVSSLALVACADSEEPAQQDNAQASGEQVSVINCGIEFTLDEPVQRAVTLEQGPTDTLLFLGVEDQMAGTSNQKEEIRPEFEEAFNSVPVLSPDPATAEQIREVDADFIYAPFTANYTADNAGTREEWVDLGVVPFLSNTECREEPENEGLELFELLAKDYEQLGQFFGAEEEAEELAQRQEESIARAEEVAAGIDESPTMAVLYSFYDGAPYIAGSTAIAQDMIDFAGGINVFDDVEEDWPEISWEAFADRDPEIIILVDLSGRGAPGDTWEEKVAELESNPATANLDAVVNERYLVVPGAGFTQSVNSMETLDVMVEALDEGITGGGPVGATSDGEI